MGRPKKEDGIFKGLPQPLVYRKRTAYQNIRIINKKINEAKSLDKLVSQMLLDEKRLNQEKKRENIKLRKRLKEYRTRQKQGVKNKG